MYLQTPKRPNLPPTPSTYNNRTSLPPLSSILSTSQDTHISGKLPSIDTFTSTPTTTKYYSNHPIVHTPYQSMVNLATPSKAAYPTAVSDTSDADISINEIKKPAARAKQSVQSTHSESKAYAFISHSPATFPSQEPSIDNAPLARRKRRRTSPNELSILNTEFELGSTPNKLRRIEIAKKVSMNEKAVQIWFQNKRQSLRKQYNHEKEVTVLPPTPPISTTHLVSSTPTKPIINKSQSFINSPSASITSPIRQRSNSNPTFSKPQHPLITPTTNKTIKSTTTPNSSYSPDDSNTSIDVINTSTLILNETKKKQPEFLNSSDSSTMTFKLTPTTKNKSSMISKSNKINDINDKENKNSKTNIRNILNTSTSTTTRKPLGEISSNKVTTSKKLNENECVENLLSLRSGNWN